MSSYLGISCWLGVRGAVCNGAAKCARMGHNVLTLIFGGAKRGGEGTRCNLPGGAPTPWVSLHIILHYPTDAT